jgi:dihydroorotate dehydrogenase
MAVVTTNLESEIIKTFEKLWVHIGFSSFESDLFEKMPCMIYNKINEKLGKKADVFMSYNFEDKKKKVIIFNISSHKVELIFDLEKRKTTNERKFKADIGDCVEKTDEVPVIVKIGNRSLEKKLIIKETFCDYSIRFEMDLI